MKRASGKVRAQVRGIGALGLRPTLVGPPGGPAQPNGLSPSAVAGPALAGSGERLIRLVGAEGRPVEHERREGSNTDDYGSLLHEPPRRSANSLVARA